MINKESVPLVIIILFVLGLIIGMVIGTGFHECEKIEVPKQVDEKVYFYCEAECMHIIKEGELIEVENAEP